MQLSLKPKNEFRTKVARIAAAVGFALLIGSFAVGSARADNGHDGNDRDRGSDQHRDNDRRDYRGPAVVYAPAPDYNYYAPQPNYYTAPDPYYYGPGPGYDAPPPQGVTLFFGL
jgi:hypothetical protein